MLSVRIVCVGKIKEQYFRDAITEYEKRLKTLCKFEIIEIPESRLQGNPSQLQIEAGLKAEGEIILQKAKGLIVPMCIEGKMQSSEEFSKTLESAMQSHGAISFIIGSSFGLWSEVKQAGAGMSMSKMTFPHTLARVMLTEQIYRGLMILGNSKYHK